MPRNKIITLSKKHKEVLRGLTNIKTVTVKLQTIFKDLVKHGHSDICPCWVIDYTKEKAYCKVCQSLFSKVITGEYIRCPCSAYKHPRYLATRVQLIIDYLEEIS